MNMNSTEATLHAAAMLARNRPTEAEIATLITALCGLARAEGFADGVRHVHAAMDAHIAIAKAAA